MKPASRSSKMSNNVNTKIEADSALRLSRLSLAIRAGFIGAGLAHGAAQAATITVNSNTDDGTGCTLREAIVSANTSANQSNGCAIGSSSGTDTITFSNSLVSNTLTLSNGRLFVGSGKDIEINASAISRGITIDANKGSRVLKVSSASLEVSNLNLTGGLVSGGEVDGGGLDAYNSTLTLRNTSVSGNSAQRRGGGIHSRISSVNLYNSTVDNNITTGGEYSGASGGGIHAREAGNVTLTNSTVSSNISFRTGGIHARDGVSLTINNSRVTGNVSGGEYSYGGGIYIYNANMVIDSSTISGNSAHSGGGFAINTGDEPVIVNNSTISGNSVSDFGGGFSVYGSESVLLVKNSTVSANIASRAGGIGVYRATATLNNSTIAGNSASRGAGLYSSSRNGRTTLNNSIVANSLGADDCFTDDDVIVDSATIIEDSTCSANRAGDPGLLSLANNGGPTQTHALRINSNARNSSTGVCLATDQRGETRNVSDGVCDVGAFEFVEDLDDIDETNFFVIPLKNGKSVIFGL